ncbi:MAG: DNA gyrase subunit A, partial [Acidimicrobiales bacterium]
MTLFPPDPPADAVPVGDGAGSGSGGDGNGAGSGSGGGGSGGDGASGGGDGPGPSLPGIEPIEIQEEMRTSFLEYAMATIVSRALPDVRDGLKPVHRRILYDMHVQGYRPDRPHVKCAKVTGDTMSRFHPHGNQAIYDALARMAQPFSLRDPLIDFHGNYGSTDYPPAAERYTECRLSPLSMHMLEGIDEDTVEMGRNYTNEEDEPTVLPSRLPNLLINGSQGIAVGMATNIPPHNLGEVIDAVLHLIDNPESTPDDLMHFVKGPDFPTGALILGRAGMMDAYRTGRGSIKMRARAEIVEETKGGQQIIVTELPYQLGAKTVMEKVADLVNSHELEGIRNIVDLSKGVETKIVVELKRDANASVVLNNLFKHTPLQTSFGVNMVALVDGVPRTLNLVQALRAYVDHQVDVIRRRTEFRLAKARARAHIVEGLLKALDMIDAIIAAIRASEDRGAARAALMAAPFEFSEIQANHILDMQLARLTRLGRADLEKELAELRQTIAELEAILADEGQLRAVIKAELGAIRAKYASPRRAVVTFDEGEMSAEDLIVDEEIVLTMTKAGYIKAVTASTFRTQGRGGRGVRSANLKEEDLVTKLIHTSAHAHLLFFSNQGKVYRLRAYEVPVKERTARGTALVNLLPLEPGERIQALIDTRDFPTDRYLFFATRDGQVKKTNFAEYDKSRREGFIAINLREGDELVGVIQTGGEDDIFMVSRQGMTIRFAEDDV